jgi:hypothetical protein
MGKGTFIERRNSRNDVNQNYGLNRVNKEGTTQYANTPPGRSNVNTPIDKFLATDGGKLHAPVGFDKKTIIIDGSNAIDIAQGGGNFVPRIVLDGSTSTTLDTISNPLFEGQKIYLQAYSSGTITIGTAGNIQTAMSLTANHIMELIYDFDVAKWIMPEDNVGSASGGADNLGDHTATQDLTMTTHDINLTTGDVNFTNSSGTINFGSAGATTTSGTNTILLQTVASTEVWRAQIGTVQFNGNTLPKTDSTWTLGSTTKYWSDLFTDHIELSGGLQMQAGNYIVLGNGGNSIRQSNTNGNLEYRTNSTSVDHSFFVGSLVMNLNKDTVEMRLPVDMSSNKILDVTYIQSDTSVAFTENSIDMGSASNPIIIKSANTISMTDISGAFFTTSSSGIDWTRKLRPFLSILNVDLGDSTHEWNDAYFQGDVKFSTGGTVDFFDVDSSAKSTGGAAALPANPTSYWKVKFNGNTRWIPYYTT